MVVNRQRRVPVDVGPLQVFVNQARHELGLGKGELTVCLVSDAAIAGMNRRFRGKRGPTDVLSFPANGAGPRHRGKVTERTEATEGTGAAYLGDIAISPETARRNARRFSRPLPQELRILILHGMLHLLGYDHETDHGEMERLERRLRRRLGLS